MMATKEHLFINEVMKQNEFVNIYEGSDDLPCWVHKSDYARTLAAVHRVELILESKNHDR